MIKRNFQALSICLQLLLSLFSTLPRSAQEEVVEYAVNVGSTQDSSEDSVFFHPWFESEEKASFQQELVLMFNKLVDVGSDEKLLQSVICDILKASLLSPHLTLNKMVQEGVKSAGHAKSICHVSSADERKTGNWIRLRLLWTFRGVSQGIVRMCVYFSIFKILLLLRALTWRRSTNVQFAECKVRFLGNRSEYQNSLTHFCSLSPTD